MNRIVFCLHNCFMRNMNYTHPSVIIVLPEISFIIQDGCFLRIWHINAAKLPEYVPKLESADTGHREKKASRRTKRRERSSGQKRRSGSAANQILKSEQVKTAKYFSALCAYLHETECYPAANGVCRSE